jgi:hypothetical protein
MDTPALGPSRLQPAGVVVPVAPWEVGTPVQKLEIPLRPPESEADAISTPVSVAKATIRKDAPVKDLKKCVGALCCAGMLGCTGTAQSVRPLPPPEDCPAGAEEAMDKYDLSFVAVDWPEEGFLDRSTVRVQFMQGQLAPGYAEGRVFVGEGRIYGRFVKATKGKLSIPICMAVYDLNTKELGVPANTGETPAKPEGVMALERVTRLP